MAIVISKHYKAVKHIIDDPLLTRIDHPARSQEKHGSQHLPESVRRNGVRRHCQRHQELLLRTTGHREAEDVSKTTAHHRRS